ncbi:GrpB family protein [Clostridium ljungdahlii]|uniref:GrpB family protein n=1 Tax=Clostridium ljungdahlii TaxID=1538 RepID=UPI00386B63C9
MERNFGDNVNYIQHVGSTSISGIYAKPILDIAIVLKSFEDMNIEGMKRQVTIIVVHKTTKRIGIFLF